VTLPRETVLDLMGLADGMLEGDAKAKAEQLVASNEEARLLVDTLRASPVGDWVRESTDRQASAAVAGIADSVMARLAADASGAVEGGVVRMAPWVRRGSRRGPAVVAGVGAALVLAASIALYVRSGSQRSDEELAPVASVAVPPVGVPSVALPAPSASASQAEAKTAAAGGVEVNAVEAPSRAVSVFRIPMGAAAAAANAPHPSSVVIWVEEDTGTK